MQWTHTSLRKKHSGRRNALAVIAILVTLAIASLLGTRNRADAAPALAGAATEQAALKIDPIAFQNAMRDLWADHMQWTYSTVDAFFHNPTGLDAQLGRLLQNQKDLGAAIVPFYGKAAGDKLTALLTTHIQQAVPVLKSAQNGDKAALDKALADWYANAGEIASFLTAANPKHWPTSATGPMMKGHIDQTTAYAVDLLKGDYATAIKHYDEAYDHMMMLAGVLSGGLIAQFPRQFGK